MLFIAMRASSNKSAHRHLAARKRSIVVIVAGLAMVLGTTSVGASLFGNNDDVLIRERATTRTLQQAANEDGQSLNSDNANTLNQDVLGTTNPSTSTGATRKAESAGSAASSAVVDHLQSPTTPPSDPGNNPVLPPADPTTPPATDPTDPNPIDPTTPPDNGNVLGDSTTNPDPTAPGTTM